MINLVLYSPNKQTYLLKTQGVIQDLNNTVRKRVEASGVDVLYFVYLHVVFSVVYMLHWSRVCIHRIPYMYVYARTRPYTVRRDRSKVKGNIPAFSHLSTRMSHDELTAA